MPGRPLPDRTRLARAVEARTSRFLLVGLVVAHLVVISRQVERGGSTLLDQVLFSMLSPFQQGVSAVVRGVAGGWSSYVDLRQARSERENLRGRVRELELLVQLREERVRESERLRQIVELRAVLPLETIVCEVVAQDGVPWFRTVTVDKGTYDGVALEAPVVSASGVVGRVVAVGPSAAKVQLLLDRDSGVGVRIERTRVAGVISGQVGVVDTGTTDLVMKYVPSLADVSPGDVVVTSGLDQVFPKGLMVGRVRSVGRPSNLFREILVAPSAGFESLEQVLVLKVPLADRSTPQVLR